MRRQHFLWTFLVLAIVLLGYGSFSIIYNHTHQKELSVLGIIFCSMGGLLLIIYIVLLIVSTIQKLNQKPEEKVIDVEVKEEIKYEYNTKVEVKHESSPRQVRDDTEYVSRKSGGSSSSVYDAETIYVKKVGYGPIIRVCGSQILDMRSNTYYRIEGNRLNQQGYGFIYEIYGDKIKLSYGSYLYEISGSNISKVYGGYFANFNGNFIQTNDLKEIYEVSGSLNKKQQLCVVALLFGTY